MATPSAPILDAFTRANEKPLANGTWAALRGEDTGEIVSNLLKLITSNKHSGKWSAATYTGHQQVYADIVTVGSPWVELWLCTTGSTEATAVGYSFEWEAGTYTILRIDTGGAKTVLASVAGTLVAGDGMWFDRDASGNLRGYRRHEGTWTEVLNAKDTKYTSGAVGFAARATATAWELDNFGGGEASSEVPVITKPADKVVSKNVALSIKPTATESPTSWEASNLPSGLSINASTGEITGSPTAGIESFHVLLHAKNAHGTSAGVEFELFITAEPKITKPTTQTNKRGDVVALEVLSAGSSQAWTAVGLPPGLSISTETGEITGTVTTVGKYTPELKMSSGAGGSATTTFEWIVEEPPEPARGALFASTRDAFPLHLTIGGEDCTFLLSESFTFSNVDPGGYEMASFPIPKDMPQVVRGMPVRVDCGLKVAWEGRVKEIQRSLGAKTLIQCEGYGARLLDTTMAEVFIDRDLTRWRAPGASEYLQRSKFHSSFGTLTTSPNKITGSPSVVLNISGEWASPYSPLVQAWYEAPPGVTLGLIYYSLSLINASGEWEEKVFLLTEEHEEASAFVTANLNNAGAGASGYLEAPSGTHPFALISHRSTHGTPGGTSGGEFGAAVEKLAVYGTGFHTFNVGGFVGSDPSGFYPRQAVEYCVSKTPGIKKGIIEAGTGLIVPHAVYYTPVEMQTIIADMAKLVGWHWGVWESLAYLAGSAEPRLDFRPYPESPTAYVWRSECESIDVREDLAGQYNTAQVQYTEAAGNAGVVEVKVDNPILDAAGVSNRTIALSLGVSVKAAAETYGKLALEALQTQARVVGSATIKEPIHTTSGARMAPWMLKAGIDRLRVPDLPSFDVWGNYNSLPISRVECSGSSSGISTSVEFGLGHNLMEALTAQLQQVAVLGGN